MDGSGQKVIGKGKMFMCEAVHSKVKLLYLDLKEREAAHLSVSVPDQLTECWKKFEKEKPREVGRNVECGTAHWRDNHRIHEVHGLVIPQTWKCQLQPTLVETCEKEGAAGSPGMSKPFLSFEPQH